MECQNPGCEVSEPQFYSRNRTICKECFLKKHEEEKEQKRLKQRNIKKAAKDAVKKEKMLEKAKQEIKALREKEKTESADMTKRTEFAGGTSSSKSVPVKRGRKKVDSKEPKPSVPVALGNAYMAMNPSGMVRSDPGLTGIIATQQKMIEYQQRQTDHLFALTEKLMNRLAPVPTETKTLSGEAKTVSTPAKTLSGEAKVKVQTFESEEISARIIPPTPRRYPRLSHTKDRRTNDIKIDI
jgi:hypothetical protein